MTTAIPPSVADRIYRSVVDGYDAANGSDRGDVFLARLTVLMATEIGSPERVDELITLANHKIERETA